MASQDRIGEFGTPKAAFKTGTYIELDPCDEDGNDKVDAKEWSAIAPVLGEGMGSDFLKLDSDFSGDLTPDELESLKPLFDRLETHYAEARIHFKPGTARGLRAAPGALDCFEVAGADGAFVPATASPGVAVGSTTSPSAATTTSTNVSRIERMRLLPRG